MDDIDHPDAIYHNGHIALRLIEALIGYELQKGELMKFFFKLPILVAAVSFAASAQLQQFLP